MTKPKDRRPLLRVVDTASATLVGPDQVPTADLIPQIDWTPRPTWRVKHASDGRILITQHGQTVLELRPHEAPALLASIYRAIAAFESGRHRVGGRP